MHHMLYAHNQLAQPRTSGGAERICRTEANGHAARLQVRQPDFNDRLLCVVRREILATAAGSPWSQFAARDRR